MEHAFLTLAQYYQQTDFSSLGYSTYGSNSMAGGGGSTMIGLVLIGLAALIGFIVQNRLQASVKRYSETPAPLTGAQTARLMLDSFGLQDVAITHVKGQLTDHYNPMDKTVNLSDTVYGSASVAAMAVAAHECGHAVQHATAYTWLGLRSKMVPVVNIGSRLGQIVLIGGMLLAAMGGGTTIAWIGLALFATTTVFALVTLPVEFDASRRALAWLEKSRLATLAMHGEASTALKWAAMTYVAAALSSIAMLAYYALILLNRRD